MPINGLNRTMTMQPSMNIEELLNSQKTDDAKKAENPSDVGKTDKTGAKAELEEVVHDDTALNGQTAENFVKNNKVEAGKDKKTEESDKTGKSEKKDGADKTDKAEKKDGAEKTDKAEGDKKTEGEKKADGDVKVWFDKHPRFKLAMFILEQVLDAVIGVMSGIASKLPGCSGGCITGGLSILKGLAGLHKMENFEKDFPKVMKEISKGGASIANALVPKTVEKKTVNQTAQIINCVGTMCSELSGAKSWEDALNAVGKSAAGIASAANPKAAPIADAVKSNMSNFTNAISRGVKEVKTAVNNSDATNDGKTTKALEMFGKILADDKSLSEEEKKLVKALSDGAIESINAKGSKKTLDAYENTLGAVASAVLKGRNKQIAEQTLALMKEIRAEQDPFKAALIVLDKAQQIAGGESNEIETLKEVVADACKTVEKAGKMTAEKSGEKSIAEMSTAEIDADIQKTLARVQKLKDESDAIINARAKS